MSQEGNDPKTLHLTEEEALALLDLCVMSPMDSDPINERALLKLIDLVRSYPHPPDICRRAAKTWENTSEALVGMAC